MIQFVHQKFSSNMAEGCRARAHEQAAKRFETMHFEKSRI